MPFSVSIAKRIIDILISFFALMVLFPIGIVIAMLIKLDSHGPVFYKQLRVKRCMSNSFLYGCIPSAADTFLLYKFRTMVNDAEKDSGAINAGEDDPRVTKIGKFLRHTRIDEFPNLINVLIGDMSIVGPRADRLEIFKEVESDFPIIYERTRYVKPGITGYAQLELRSNGSLNSDDPLTSVVAKHDLELPAYSFRYKMYYDFSYVMKLSSFWSFIKTDFMIMLKTPYIMFFKRNVI